MMWLPLQLYSSQARVVFLQREIERGELERQKMEEEACINVLPLLLLLLLLLLILPLIPL